MAAPVFLAKRIAHICQSTRINVSTEQAAHNALVDALTRAGMTVAREVWLNPTDRIDIMVEGVGIEVKIKGGRRAIYRQLQRYAACDQVSALVLATAAAWPPKSAVDGKPFFHASLVQGWL